MNPLEYLFSLLKPDVWAIYITGFVAIGVAVCQYKSNFKQNKKVAVFDELSKDIEESSNLLVKIGNDSNEIINHLANAANTASANFDPSLRTQPEIQTEIDRRLKEIEDTYEKQKKLLTTIYESYLKVLVLIKKIEKSTVISTTSKKASRYMFFSAQEQYELVNSAIAVLQSFHVTPPFGGKPSVSPDTFNSFIKLMEIINNQNQTLSTYLEDLSVVLHNDLVKNIYGRAKYTTIPNKHLSSSGFTDKRAKDNLL